MVIFVILNVEKYFGINYYLFKILNRKFGSIDL